MLYDLLESGWARGKDLNCAETILYGANEAYALGLPKEALKMAGPFGGGMGIESVCGALTGALMVLGRLFVEDRAHISPHVKDMEQDFLNRFRESMGSIDCAPLKDRHRSVIRGCEPVILEAARILDQIIAEANRRRAADRV